MWKTVSQIVKEAKENYQYGYIDIILLDPCNIDYQEAERLYAQARILFGKGDAKVFNVKGHSWFIKFYGNPITFGETELLLKLSNVSNERPYRYQYKGTIVTNEFKNSISNKEKENAE